MSSSHRYFAVFRLSDNEKGTCAEYDAKDVVEAVNKMVEISRVSKEVATNGFYEYEIYEVIGPRQYVTVACKLPQGKTKQNGPFPYKDDEPAAPAANKLATPVTQPQPAVVKPAALFTVGKL